MILRLKFLCAALIRFVRQWRVRPIGNNLRLLFNSIGIIFSRRVSNAQYATKHRLNTAVLKRDLAYRPSDLATQPCEKPRVWTFWWQGEEAMPEIIRATVDSIRRAAGDKEMVLITKDNYADYVQIPAYILKKVNEGGIGLPHLSDFIRASLLDEYGGLWIDSTIFCARQLPADLFTRRFFTVRDEGDSLKYQSRGLWNMQVLGSCERHYPLFRSLRLMLEDYWQHYNSATDYLFFDSLVDWILEENDDIRADLLAMPRTNTHMHELHTCMDEPYDNELFNRWAADGTYMYKLTYKRQYSALTQDGRQTFYGFITTDFGQR